MPRKTNQELVLGIVGEMLAWVKNAKAGRTRRPYLDADEVYEFARRLTVAQNAEFDEHMSLVRKAIDNATLAQAEAAKIIKSNGEKK